MGQVLEDLWQYILAAGAAVIWLVRLEGRTNANAATAQVLKAEIIALEHRLIAQRAEDMAASRESRDEVRKSLDRMGDDIKLILEKLGARR